uniref:(northern house mosquito) hypothetical protein n=1 Tax=Culex pipiens TaxID=7175 RepID=A0A8D8FYB2_CULPI
MSSSNGRVANLSSQRADWPTEWTSRHSRTNHECDNHRTSPRSARRTRKTITKQNKNQRGLSHFERAKQKKPGSSPNARWSLLLTVLLGKQPVAFGERELFCRCAHSLVLFVGGE